MKHESHKSIYQHVTLCSLCHILWERLLREIPTWRHNCNKKYRTIFSPFSRVICPTKFKNWRTLKSFWGIIYHICGVSLPPIPGHLEVWGTQRIDILIKVILHCKMVQIGHFQRVIREVSRGCLMVPIILTCQDMSIFR